MIIIKGTDQRKFPRRSFQARVEIHDHIRGRKVSGLAVDINPMGMRVETRRPFSVGEILSLRFPSPEGDYDITLSGEIVRKDDGGNGVEFFDLEDWIFEELCAYVYQSGGDKKAPLVLTVEQSMASP